MTPWVSPQGANPLARVRLFCLPHAGAGAAGYFRWKRLLPAEIEVIPVLLPGREGRLAELPITDAETLLGELHHALAPMLDRPYAIFGHSMGSLLAYGWAQKIQAAKWGPPVHLFLSGRNAPQMTPKHSPVCSLPDTEFVAALAERYGGMPSVVLDDPELREVFLPILRADLSVVETYAHLNAVKLETSLSVCAGAEDATVSDEGLAAFAALTEKSSAVRRFSGDHFYLFGAAQGKLLHEISRRLLT